MKTKLEKSLEYIIGYCDKHHSCKDNCKLCDDDGYCLFLKTQVPVDWKIGDGDGDG